MRLTKYVCMLCCKRSPRTKWNKQADKTKQARPSKL